MTVTLTWLARIRLGIVVLLGLLACQIVFGILTGIVDSEAVGRYSDPIQRMKAYDATYFMIWICKRVAIVVVTLLICVVEPLIFRRFDRSKE